MAGSEENYSCDLGSERVKILTATSMHSSCVFNFVNTKQTEHLLYIQHTCTMHSTTTQQSCVKQTCEAVCPLNKYPINVLPDNLNVHDMLGLCYCASKLL